MNKYKVCVYAICKNEEQFVDRWLEAVNEADGIFVTDTGSVDSTVEKLRAGGAVVYLGKVHPWRFDVARNISLDHVPEDTDICVCIDLDEVPEKGWRNCLEEVWTPDANMAGYIYNWRLNNDGTSDVQFNNFKAHSRDDYEWVYPVHECLNYTGKLPEKTVFAAGMVLNHYPDNTKSRDIYLHLLETAVEESPENDRLIYYLGREYMYKEMWGKCIETLKVHLSLKSSVWKEERCASMRWIAKSYFRLSNFIEAYHWYFRAVEECPDVREPYMDCAKMAYRLKNWEMALFMVERALEINKKSSGYVNYGYCWDNTPDYLAAVSCYRLNMYEKALRHATAALSFCPGDKQLMSVLSVIENKCNGHLKNIADIRSGRLP